MAYCMYTKPIGDIIPSRHGLMHHVYADDTQIYFTLKPSPDNWSDAITRMENCVSEVKAWMELNLLKLNDDKTELIVFTPKHHKHLCSGVNVTIGGCKVEPATHVRNLGIIFDQKLSMEKHITTVSRNCRYHLRNISRIRKYLTDEACKTLVQALVTSRIDYGNVLLYGLPRTTIGHLQRVQNSAARVVMKIPRTEHITPILRELHWLPVERRIEYKLLLYTYKALHDMSPVYIKDMIQPHRPGRSLRSQNSSQLQVPKSRTVRFGDRTFHTASPLLWNALPISLKDSPSVFSFKRNLKTHLFKQTYID